MLALLNLCRGKSQDGGCIGWAGRKRLSQAGRRVCGRNRGPARRMAVFPAGEPVRCIGHRSVLHQPTQRAAQAIAACCVFRGRMQSFSVYPSLMSHFMLFELAGEHVPVPNHYSTEVQFPCLGLHRSSLRVSGHPDLQLVNQRSWLMRSAFFLFMFRLF